MLLERWKALLDDSPDNLEVHPKVFMDKDVSKRSDISPGDFRVSLSEIGGQIPDRLTYHLQIANHRILYHGILKKCRATPGRVGLHPGNGITDVS